MREEMKPSIAGGTPFRGLCRGLLMLAAALLPAAGAMAAEAPSAAVERVREFVAGEFAGAEDLRASLALIVPATQRPRTASGEDPDALDGQVFSLVGDALVVVSRYELGVAESDGAVVVVPVDFSVVATTQGQGVGGRRFVRAASASERVRYRVLLRKGEWLVQDPPLPHVSAQALLQSYRKQVDYAKEKLLPLPQTSRAQRETFAAMEREMNALQVLAGETP
ncbi:hypothetical protein DFR29_11597 [Tahibacter aquaticus]|uniref:DUF4468 domain-containing protein n=2 Tax=Tahibacter aquaticus TaxID=520092 RepID=A0A4R6YPJ6_9GAMM|nr:hypothetical protein DFR29_11597 [Tahibacter aquaticus]